MWTREAQWVDSFTVVPVLRISRAIPAMTASGIVRPKILLSGLAESMLTAKELQTSLRHELAHVHRRDNLKKLILRCVPFPGMRVLEGTWLEATEMAADDAAVSNAGEALDLASALIKLSRVEAIQHPSDLTAALAHSSGSVMKTRVERLIAWSDDHFASPHRFSSSCGPEYGLGAILAMFAVLTVTYGQLLVRVHTITEWLVR